MGSAPVSRGSPTLIQGWATPRKASHTPRWVGGSLARIQGRAHPGKPAAPPAGRGLTRQDSGAGHTPESQPHPPMGRGSLARIQGWATPRKASHTPRWVGGSLARIQGWATPRKASPTPRWVGGARAVAVCLEERRRGRQHSCRRIARGGCEARPVSVRWCVFWVLIGLLGLFTGPGHGQEDDEARQALKGRTVQGPPRAWPRSAPTGWPGAGRPRPLPTGPPGP
jgi:hypothetical protein